MSGSLYIGGLYVNVSGTAIDHPAGGPMTSEQGVDLTQFLTQQYLCESLTVNETQKLLEYTKLVKYDKNQIIADMGEVGDALYFCVSGDAVLTHEENGQETEVGRFKAGEMMGEMSFFDRRPRLLRIRALSDGTQLLKLSRPMYERLKTEHPYIAVNLLENAIISLDHLFRRVSRDEINLARYMFGKGKR
jgi:CRP/FNR family cyclic AMP-dependent transcriptional regulator